MIGWNSLINLETGRNINAASSFVGYHCGVVLVQMKEWFESNFSQRIYA